MKLAALLTTVVLADSVVYTGPQPNLVTVRAKGCDKGERVACGRIWVEGERGKLSRGWIALNVFKAHLDQDHRLVSSSVPEFSVHVQAGEEFTIDMSDGSSRWLYVLCDLCVTSSVLIEPANSRVEFVLKRGKPPPGFPERVNDD